jgi:hypothetical protein
VKIAPDLSDIFIGHATWWTYTSMLRIYKHYTFELQGEQYKTHTTSMSSYPGEGSVDTPSFSTILLKCCRKQQRSVLPAQLLHPCVLC